MPGITAPWAESTSGTTVAVVDAVAIHLLAPSPAVTIVRGCSRGQLGERARVQIPHRPAWSWCDDWRGCARREQQRYSERHGGLAGPFEVGGGIIGDEYHCWGALEDGLTRGYRQGGRPGAETTVVPPSGSAVRDWNSLTDGVGSTVGSGSGVTR